MSIGAILDVGIGLMFVFLLLGLIVSALQEAVAALLALRGKYLLEGLSTILAEQPGAFWLARRHLLSTKRDEGSNLFQTVANHALVNGITPSAIPSYVPAGNFAKALIDALRGGGTGQVVTDVEAAIAKLEGPAGQALKALFADSKGDMDAFQKTVETWFNDAMDRVTGVYKRWTQYFALILGIAIAVALNADAVSITKQLYNDPVLRQAAAAAATAYVDRCTADKPPEDCPKPPAEDTATPPAGGPVDTLKGKVEATQAAYKRVEEQLTAVGYPIGWSKDRLPNEWYSWASAILGWLITGLAVSLGAPFWFDMLKLFVNVRGAGVKPEDDAKKSPK